MLMGIFTQCFAVFKFLSKMSNSNRREEKVTLTGITLSTSTINRTQITDEFSVKKVKGNKDMFLNHILCFAANFRSSLLSQNVDVENN